MYRLEISSLIYTYVLAPMELKGAYDMVGVALCSWSLKLPSKDDRDPPRSQQM